ncbi:MAG TPA: crossover junction endodeoxyribonuclease RuvC [Dehalococcoidia bacterium]|nr:crossover junction endodeoxyribonuclease RuvC [Dehalococcoidia bacterium]
MTSSPEPVILGIDPGLRICGWGVVRGGQRAGYIASGAIKPNPKAPITTRLLTIYEAIKDLILAYSPDEVAIEDPFVGSIQPASALAIGQARAAAVLAAASNGLEVELYAPAAVKAAVSGYGQGDKRQVQSMVRLLLGLAEPPEPVDAADALAVAICHLGNRRARALERASKP